MIHLDEFTVPSSFDLGIALTSRLLRRLSTRSLVLLLIALVGFVVGISLGTNDPGASHGRMLVVLAVFASLALSALGITTLVHEAAHALVALLLGYRLHGIDLGIGPGFSEFHVRKCRIRLGVPLGGRTYISPRGLRRSRWREATFGLAGIGANVVLALVLIQLLETRTGLSTQNWVGRFVLVLAVTNLVAIVTNVWPWRPRTADGTRLPTDGLQVLRLFTRPRAS